MLDFKDYNSIIVTHYAIGKANNGVKKGIPFLNPYSIILARHRPNKIMF